MKRFALSVVTCLFLCSMNFAWAIDVEVPNLTVLGAEKLVPLGDIVRLSLSKVENKPSNLSNIASDWRIFDGDTEKTFIPQADGSILLGTGMVNKQYRVLVSISYLYLLKDGDKITGVEIRSRLLVQTLKVGAELPPTPPPIPVIPNFPPGKYGLSASTYRNVYASVTDDGTRASTAARIANNFDSMAARIAAGTIKDLKTALEEITRDNKATLGTAAPVWNVFFELLQNETYNAYQLKTLLTAADFQIVCNEVAIGLRAIK